MAKQDTATRAEEIERIVDEAAKSALENTGDDQDLLLFLAGVLRRHASVAQKRVTKMMRSRVAEIAKGKTDTAKQKVRAAA